MRVSVFGTGYVGLVTGACLAKSGNDVVCMDIDQAKVERLNSGEIPIFEPGLEPIVQANIEAGRLRFTSDAQAAVGHGEYLFVAVGTPPGEDGGADLQQVLAVASAIGDYLEDDQVVINKSTVPVGTGDLVRNAIEARLAERGVERNFAVVSNPEFLKEGAAVADFLKPDRIIIGARAEDTDAVDKMRLLYAPFNRNHDRVMAMDLRSAELTKYAANAMLATKISFMNEMANLAERVGADVEEVRKGIGSDPRIGFSFIYPGAGYGGSCFPKDVQALIRTAHSSDFDMQVLAAVEAVNQAQKEVLFSKIERYFDGNLAGKTLAVWGLAFKPDTDDLREAPSRVLLEQLWQAGAAVRAFDPQATDEARRLFGTRADLTLCSSAIEALDGADGLVLITEWTDFRSPDFDQIKQRLRHPVIFDGRNIYDPAAMAQRGLEYYGIGRGLSVQH